MEALGDAVVAGKAPHADDLLPPVVDRLSEGDGGGEATGLEGLDEIEQLREVPATVPFGLSLEAEQGAEPLLELVEAMEGGLQRQEFAQALALSRLQPVVAFAQQVQPGAVPGQLRAELPASLSRCWRTSRMAWKRSATMAARGNQRRMSAR